MTNIRTHLHALIAAAVFISPGSSQSVEVETSTFHVQLIRQGDPHPVSDSARPFEPALLRVTDKEKSLSFPVEVRNWAGVIRSLSIVDSKVLTFGESPYGDVVHIIDLVDRIAVDTIRCWHPSLSVTKQYLLYQGWHRRMDPPQARSALWILYDLTKSPIANRTTVRL